MWASLYTRLLDQWSKLGNVALSKTFRWVTVAYRATAQGQLQSWPLPQPAFQSPPLKYACLPWLLHRLLAGLAADDTELGDKTTEGWPRQWVRLEASMHQADQTLVSVAGQLWLQLTVPNS